MCLSVWRLCCGSRRLCTSYGFYRSLLILVSASVLYFEWLCHDSAAFRWRLHSRTKSSLRVLTVADAQLIGYQNEPKWLMPISRWDCDKSFRQVAFRANLLWFSYLGKTFQYALSRAQPDLIIFLGDLFDEGSVATDDEFVKTLDRFHAIYGRWTGPAIYVAGDNDIGGESGEPITDANRRRFNRAFNAATGLNQLSLGLVNIQQGNAFDGTSLALTDNTNAVINLLISHAPILTLHPYYRNRQVEMAVRPRIVLSAHDHLAGHVHKSGQQTAEKSRIRMGDSRIRRFTISLNQSNQVLELQSPTCSYRMGTPEIGFGLITLDVQASQGVGAVYLSVLWLPTRFPQLYAYGCVAAFVSFTLMLRRLLCTRN